jgi:hypothetical protein
MTWHVYSLSDPRDGAIKYVGKSLDPWRRLYTHRSKWAAGAVRNWVTELFPLEPKLEILERLGDSATEAMFAERNWIAKLRASGATLLNTSNGGERVPTSQDNKFSGFGARVRSRRTQLGIDQSQLSKLTSIGQSAISRIEGDQSLNVRVETAVLLARALDVSVEWLVTGEERVSVHASAAE